MSKRKFPRLFIFDFDNVVYDHTELCGQRQLLTGSVVANAYFNVPIHVAMQNHARCWKDHRDGFLYLLKDTFVYTDPQTGLITQVFENPIKSEFNRKRQYMNAHHAFERLCRNDVHGVFDPAIHGLLDALYEKAQICFLSHAMHPSLEMMIARLQLRPSYLKHAYGMTRLGDGDGCARKDKPDSGVYKWICEKYEVHPSDAVMIEDTHVNLISAHKEGLTTVHIHHGNRVRQDYIDYSFKTTVGFLKTLINKGLPVKSDPVLRYL